MRFEGLKELRRALKDASEGELREEMATWLDGQAFWFLEEVQKMIIQRGNVVTSRLLNSFSRGDSKNVWKITKRGLKLEVGTNLEYAQLVNDGHFTIDPSSGKTSRWVPGRWKGDRFEYDPNSKEGMLLKLSWVEGSGYWDDAKFIFERMFEANLDAQLDKYMKSKFE